ncbi:lytic transglycosylase domain-containing protein [Sphingomicrobium sediminis]|uniref:Lytic transglycosylase domain-containing protein n=1 Tax=Sphingomicrobium sediminis TaxID=2950949 RepID=A0A9X2J437_9SPHN|nr:lytic transglycosylase domain-containing protein [Sphingomicrobium sediminis]MCM8556827.1 lytic transglycosylase domain-containing protein [Sphingomicrobium sediminis]
MIRIAALMAALMATPAMAQDNQRTLKIDLFEERDYASDRAVGPQSWAGVMSAIDAGQWDAARTAILRQSSRDPMRSYALAELYLAPDSPRIEGAALAELVREAPELPQAQRLAGLAQTRGEATPPTLVERRLVGLGGAPRRTRPDAIDGRDFDALRSDLRPFVEADDGAGAEALFREAIDDGRLYGEARSEFAQRVAWIYYIEGRIPDAARLAREGRLAGRAEWQAQSAWVEGLAEWRLNNCEAASVAFRTTALGTSDRELAAAGHYWSARAEQKCGRPQIVAERLRAAATDAETFYGQLARARIGAPRQLPARVAEPDRRMRSVVDTLPNVQRARLLAESGERARAEELLRHQARVGSPTQHQALIEISKELGLGGLQYFLATNGPSGVRTNAEARYPHPAWEPDNGWRIDPFMAFSHIIQESDFRERVVSPADAVGLMQVRPGTARDTARSRGQSVTVEQLKRPETNIDHGQAFIEQMQRNSATRGELLRVIASYNAGPVPVARWATIPDDDPLLWMESLPYWETRFYIPAVLRNYFVYHAEAGTTPQALTDLIQGRTPRYPQAR